MGLFSRLMQKKARCQKCGAELSAPRLKPQSTLSSGNDHRIWEKGLALECTSCGKYTCNSCARKAASAIGEKKPICPSCEGALR
jgi:hypothetical protein